MSGQDSGFDNEYIDAFPTLNYSGPECPVSWVQWQTSETKNFVE